MAYNPHNIFARILRGELKASTIYENDHALAFHDIMPRVQTHAIVIPKGPYSAPYDFYDLATPEEVAGFHKALVRVVDILNLRKTGFRLLTNQGLHGGQEVPHFHIHVLGGEPLGPIILRQKDEL
jgi:diadenosine tetraphosphate (Ap4A) HIT family hydrolase